MSRRSDLRAQVFEIAGDRCEHPVAVPILVIGGLQPTRLMPDVVGRCPMPATELAHIYPRGMGHTGYRDHLTNVLAACGIHARSTDDLTDPEWGVIRQLLGDRDDSWPPMASGLLRAQLAELIDQRRQREGVDLERSDR